MLIVVLHLLLLLIKKVIENNIIEYIKYNKFLNLEILNNKIYKYFNNF